MVDKAEGSDGRHRSWYTPIMNKEMEEVAMGSRWVLSYIQQHETETKFTHLETLATKFFLNHAFKEVCDFFQMEHHIGTDFHLLRDLLR